MGENTQVLVYIIETNFNTFYTGITNNLIRRWKEHNNGESSYLKVFTPKMVVHIELFNCRKLAARKEKKIKRIGAKKYLLNLKYRS